VKNTWGGTKMVTIKEVKTTIAVAIAGAFGFIIALLWRDVIIGLLKLGGWWREGGFSNINDAIGGIIVVIIITLICVVGILYITKWGGIEKK
jgi:hypothetical protein